MVHDPREDERVRHSVLSLFRQRLYQIAPFSFLYRAHPWPRQRSICYKAEHANAGTNLRFLVTNLSGRSGSVFSFYNDRGECENRIEEFKNGFAADRLSCHRFRANAFRPLLHSFAYNLVNLFRLQSALVDALSTNRNAAHSVVQDRGAYLRNSSLYPDSSGQRAGLFGICHAVYQREERRL